MAYLDFISPVHGRTSRDYLGRVNEGSKAEAAEVARRFDREYWDGDRRYGYGGMRYDGRWRPVARALADHYGLEAGDRVLDIGCGKAFLLHDLALEVPGLRVVGIDISRYALEDAPKAVRGALGAARARRLPFDDDRFDLVVSINTLHNLPCHDLEGALKEMERVGRRQKYLVVESYRNEIEKMNLLYWQLTCEMFCSPREWQWWFDHCGYSGDHGFIFFE
ncbi:MAG: SAM-dependent methyltransferase [Phycisphaeraceae bacterium]|nr:SAM-dependent methyltransferase [Phycisphaeraceae bacterium]